MAHLPPGLVWLASYPKSGNTWVRLLLANLESGQDGPVDINAMPSEGFIASSRGVFDQWTLLDSGLLSADEADHLRPRVYEEIAQAAETPVWFKVHDAYTRTPAGEPLLGRHAARGAIYIVRDPRDVLVSAAHHFHCSIDAFLPGFNASAQGLCRASRGQALQLRQKLLGWSGHVASWMEQTDCPVHRVRYEDLLAAPRETLRDMLTFLECEATAAEVDRAVRFSAFPELQWQERTRGFRERPESTGSPFFRNGRAGDWVLRLTPAQVRAVEQAHAVWMSRMGYELSLSCAPEPDAHRPGEWSARACG